jgi:Uma2 family endonuclease
MSRLDLDRWIEEMPEPKLELLDGRLVVGNGAGNLRLLYHLLEGWGTESVLAMAPTHLWWEALAQGFQSFDSPHPQKPVSVWQAWAAQLRYVPDIPLAGPMVQGKHRAAREKLTMGLFHLTGHSGFVQVTGRDVVMRLGEDAFTPDVFVTGPETSRRLTDYYLDGPADLVIEILMRGHERYDREIKRQRYGAGGVPEYWIVDPMQQTVELLRWTGREYQSCTLDPDGTYRLASLPGLRFQPSKLWEENNYLRGSNPWSVESTMSSAGKGYAESEISWGDLSFDPQPGLLPRPLTFEEFASWAPEAKFELIEGKPWVGGSRGSRNVLGLLLRTQGMAKAVTVFHPREWIAALMRADEQRAVEPQRRERWWQTTRKAAALLRKKFGYGRMVVIGDLLHDKPLSPWSDVSLVALGPPKTGDTWKVSHFLYEKFRDDPDINLIEHKYATKSERQAVDSEGVEV